MHVVEVIKKPPQWGMSNGNDGNVSLHKRVIDENTSMDKSPKAVTLSWREYSRMQKSADETR